MEAEDEYSAGCSFSLMCQEDGTDLDDDGFAGDGRGDLLLIYNAAAGEDGDDEVEEYMDHLVSKESGFCSSSSCFSDAGGGELAPPGAVEWFLRARRATVKWILETRGCFGFCHRTAYLAIAYFDRFCARRCIDRSVMPWAARLLAVACVSLAAKMEEYRAPALSEFRAGDDDGYEFSCVSIRRMELLVLSTLDWRMGAVTPFEYLPCLSSRLRRGNGGGGSGAGALVSVKAAALIFSAVEAASVLDHRPSTVAAAAVLAATHGALTRETLDPKMSSLSPSFLLDKEDVYACYSLMLSQSTTPASTTTTTTGKRSSSSSCSDSTDAASIYDSAAAPFEAAASCDSKRMRLELPGGIHR
uniref:Cyclin-like domain-containing protein n=1 Tax=Oryza brachyantha TaxID=4533 RepID=J3LQU3_ORYBR